MTGKTLTEPQLAVVCREALQGLKYLHSNRLIHRDIKAGNILLNHKGQCKLADFSVSTQLQHTISKHNTVIGSPFWMAPEVVRQNMYESKADIWSLGITVIEMAEGKPPLRREHKILQQTNKALLKIPVNDPPTLHEKEKWSDALHDFLRRCLVMDAKERWSAEELLQHKFIKNAGNNSITQSLVLNAMPLIEQFRDKKNKKKLFYICICIDNTDELSQSGKKKNNEPVCKVSKNENTKNNVDMANVNKVSKTKVHKKTENNYPGNAHNNDNSHDHVWTATMIAYGKPVLRNNMVQTEINSNCNTNTNTDSNSNSTSNINSNSNCNSRAESISNKSSVSNVDQDLRVLSQNQKYNDATHTNTKSQHRQPHFDTINPFFKSSPYYCFVQNLQKQKLGNKALSAWQVFDIRQSDNIRSQDWIVRSVLEPIQDFMDTVVMFFVCFWFFIKKQTDLRLVILTIERKLKKAYARDKEQLEQHYISARRQIRESIQNVNSQKSKTNKTLGSQTIGSKISEQKSNSLNAKPRPVESTAKAKINDATTNPKSKKIDPKSQNNLLCFKSFTNASIKILKSFSYMKRFDKPIKQDKILEKPDVKSGTSTKPVF
ncbi:hypothetical protein RFI_05503 [Reticulomyxa filosa]|uniref:Protein kinase domain-containing protein n=1 Tax=Reticulomyxa filosa TaxID=46433 RepID=X6P0F3_RETFI|nr:hypothetical protein RFI_05503 [Reticulomyxa filosa]|eukprot:ETO31618.1 hypothetical protein RFI_05503 [Reticulomyxa filosa]